MKCKLCCDAEADFKGSHILPHFLIKSMVNDEESKRRDKEVSFAIENDFVNTYIGRSVSSESINRILGKDLEEEELKKNINHYTQDYFLCTRCEKRFGYIESYYSTNGMTFTKDGEMIRNKADSFIAFMFWASVVWRIDVAAKFGLKLKSKDSNRLRNILNELLGDTIEETMDKAERRKDNIQSYGYILLIDESEDDDNSNYFLAHPFNQMPYSFLINNHVLFFFIKRTQCGGLIQTFLKLERFIKKEILNPMNRNYEVLIPLPVAARNEARESMAVIKQDQMVNNWKNLLTSTLKEALPELPQHIKEKVIEESIYNYITAPTKNGEQVKLTFKRFVEVTFEVLSKYVKTEN